MSGLVCIIYNIPGVSVQRLLSSLSDSHRQVVVPKHANGILLLSRRVLPPRPRRRRRRRLQPISANPPRRSRPRRLRRPSCRLPRHGQSNCITNHSPAFRTLTVVLAEACLHVMHSLFICSHVSVHRPRAPRVAAPAPRCGRPRGRSRCRGRRPTPRRRTTRTAMALAVM